MKTIRLFKAFLLLFMFSGVAFASTGGTDNGDTPPQTSAVTMQTSCADFSSANLPIVLPDAGAPTTTDVFRFQMRFQLKILR